MRVRCEITIPFERELESDTDPYFFLEDHECSLNVLEYLYDKYITNEKPNTCSLCSVARVTVLEVKEED